MFHFRVQLDVIQATWILHFHEKKYPRVQVHQCETQGLACRLTIGSLGEDMTELGIREFVDTTFQSATEVAPAIAWDLQTNTRSKGLPFIKFCSLILILMVRFIQIFICLSILLLKCCIKPPNICVYNSWAVSRRLLGLVLSFPVIDDVWQLLAKTKARKYSTEPCSNWEYAKEPEDWNRTLWIFPLVGLKPSSGFSAVMRDAQQWVVMGG